MKKWYSVLVALILSAGVLVGCGSEGSSESTATQEEEVQEVTVDMQLSKNNGEEIIAEDEFTVEEGTTLMEVMENNYEVEQSDGFINSIEGIAGDQEEKMAWMYTINGEEAMVGANEYEIEDGDEIVFDYSSWE